MIKCNLTGPINILFVDIICNVLGEEDEEAAEDEEELDGVSSSPGKTGLISGADTDSLSPGEDADSRGETEIWER